MQAKPTASVIAAGLLSVQILPALAQATLEQAKPAIVLAPAPQVEAQPKNDEPPTLTPEDKMKRRFPQPVRVGDLIGLPILDFDDSTIGYIRQVVNTPTGKIQLIVPYARWFGWVSLGGPFNWNRRPVGVPIETVVILGRQVNALEMSREDFDNAPSFVMGQNTPIDPNTTIKIAIGRR